MGRTVGNRAGVADDCVVGRVVGVGDKDAAGDGGGIVLGAMGR